MEATGRRLPGRGTLLPMETQDSSIVHDTPTVAGHRYVLIGKFAGLSKRAAQQMIRQQGGKVIEKIDASANVIVLGEAELPKSDRLPADVIENEAVVRAIRDEETPVLMWCSGKAVMSLNSLTSARGDWG